MTRVSGWQVGLFAAAGCLVLAGGLLWTGLYGVPHHGRLGMAMFVVGATLATIFTALTDSEEGGLQDPPQAHGGPPQQSAHDQR